MKGFDTMMKDFFKSKDFTAKEFHKNSIYSNIKTTMDIDEIAKNTTVITEKELNNINIEEYSKDRAGLLTNLPGFEVVIDTQDEKGE